MINRNLQSSSLERRVRDEDKKERKMFLRNCWYVAGWSNNYEHSLKAQKLLGENIVFYRRADGAPVALEDACPHRKLPLSKGQLEGDNVVCGYHGLTFDCAGRCTDSPTQRGMMPRRAVVRSYPVVDRYRLLWIWMGDPEKANPDEIFEIENFDNPEWGYTDGGILPIECNYLWVVDNLLDPSHVAWVHVTSFAGGGTDDQPLEIENLESGKKICRVTGSIVEWVEEESFFFKLSEFQQPLLTFYEKNPDFIQPESRKNEVISFVKSGLKDLSISRTTFDWGIPVPGNDKHIMYVWLDALTNYLTAADFFDKKSFWPPDWT